jgi:hypothetical protein
MRTGYQRKRKMKKCVSALRLLKSPRRTFHDWAFASINCSSWARAFYDYHEARNQSHCTILRNLGKNGSKSFLLFGQTELPMMKPCTFKTQNFRVRNVPWAMALQLLIFKEPFNSFFLEGKKS